MSSSVSRGSLTWSRRLSVGRILLLLVILAAVAFPYFYGGYLLQTGAFVMAAGVGAIGLTILVGRAGQLSLAHAFFIGLGAYAYAILAQPSGHPIDAPDVQGHLPTWLAAIAAVVITGAAGAAFSPIAGRLRGLYLGVASLGLVYLGLHIMNVATPLTGGYNGRAVPPLGFFGITLDSSTWSVLGVDFGGVEKIWYLDLAVLLIAAWVARNIVRGRPGRALEAIRDNETSALVMGVNVIGYKAGAFVVSSMYAGAAGVLIALGYQHIVPDSFQVGLSIDYLAMIAIGGLGSVAGAVVGAVFVVGLQQVLPNVAGDLPFLAQPGSGGVTAGVAAQLGYALLVVLAVRFVPGGVVQIAGLIRNRLPSRRSTRGEDASDLDLKSRKEQ